MALPLLAVYGIPAAAAAGATLYAWLSGDEDAWYDPEIFNSRMKALHTSAIDTNKFMDKNCPNWNRSNHHYVTWKSFINNFGTFYGEVGKIDSVDDDEAEEAKRYSSMLRGWMETLPSICPAAKAPITPATTGTFGERVPAEPAEPTDWLTIAKISGGVVGALLLANLLKGLRG